ncbi:hypothetical protein SKAU_G00282130 [Synaphobranchus kaupii]|uniref:Uncharacterized protein n=1 Tax=Synaphobranchus kaupii TaxID=118154 RepID=A0A9Q1EXF5_SYNKA|nr:hypothetical protein SKAU_G00282130 [Synaphobranchus kaupii]
MKQHDGNPLTAVQRKILVRFQKTSQPSGNQHRTAKTWSSWSMCLTHNPSVGLRAHACSGGASRQACVSAELVAGPQKGHRCRSEVGRSPPKRTLGADHVGSEVEGRAGAGRGRDTEEARTVSGKRDYQVVEGEAGSRVYNRHIPSLMWPRGNGTLFFFSAIWDRRSAACVTTCVRSSAAQVCHNN